MVVNNTGKKYCNIQYQYQANKVLPMKTMHNVNNNQV